MENKNTVAEEATQNTNSEDLKIMSLGLLIDLFRKYNQLHNVEYGTDKPTVEAVIVFKQSNFTKPYSELERSYKVSNVSGKIFFYDMLGSSIYGDCLDGKDSNVRLDWTNWTVDYCYVLNGVVEDGKKTE